MAYVWQKNSKPQRVMGLKTGGVTCVVGLISDWSVTTSLSCYYNNYYHFSLQMYYTDWLLLIIYACCACRKRNALVFTCLLVWIHVLRVYNKSLTTEACTRKQSRAVQSWARSVNRCYYYTSIRLGGNIRSFWTHLWQIRVAENNCLWLINIYLQYTF